MLIRCLFALRKYTYLLSFQRNLIIVEAEIFFRTKVLSVDTVSRLTGEYFCGQTFLSFLGGLAIAVPGEVRGMYEAHKKYGRLPWRKLVEPSIILAREGFEISAAVADALNNTDRILEHIKNDPGLRYENLM